MCVASYDLVVMIDIEHAAVIRMVFGGNHHPCSGGHDRGANRSREVQPFMEGAAAGEWIKPPAKTREVVTNVDRLIGRQQLRFDLVAHQNALDHVHVVGTVIDVMRQACQRLLEFDHGQIVRLMVGIQASRFSLDAPGFLLKIELLWIDTTQTLDLLVQRIQTHDLRLHFAQLDRHRPQVFLQIFVFVDHACCRVGRSHGTEKRQTCSVTQRDVIQQRDGQQDCPKKATILSTRCWASKITDFARLKRGCSRIIYIAPSVTRRQRRKCDKVSGSCVDSHLHLSWQR